VKGARGAAGPRSEVGLWIWCIVSALRLLLSSVMEWVLYVHVVRRWRGAAMRCLGRAALGVRHPMTLFGYVWLISGSLWTLSAKTCQKESPPVYSLAVAMLASQYLFIFLPLCLLIVLLPLAAFNLPLYIQIITAFSDRGEAPDHAPQPSPAARERLRRNLDAVVPEFKLDDALLAELGDKSEKIGGQAVGKGDGAAEGGGGAEGAEGGGDAAGAGGAGAAGGAGSAAAAAVASPTPTTSTTAPTSTGDATAAPPPSKSGAAGALEGPTDSSEAMDAWEAGAGVPKPLEAEKSDGGVGGEASAGADESAGTDASDPEESAHGKGGGRAGVPMCAVCLEEFHVGDVVRRLPCARHHIFHKDCIDGWFRRSYHCPLCRQSIWNTTSGPHLRSRRRPPPRAPPGGDGRLFASQSASGDQPRSSTVVVPSPPSSPSSSHRSSSHRSSSHRSSSVSPPAPAAVAAAPPAVSATASPPRHSAIRPIEPGFPTEQPSSRGPESPHTDSLHEQL
jgi:Ring finger domain